MTDPRIAYYAAGILEWMTSTGSYEFTSEDPSRWRYEDPENDMFGESGHYLPDPALRALALEMLVELGVLSRVVDRYGPEMYATDDRNVLAQTADRFPRTPFEYTARFRAKWITSALDNINRELREGISPPAMPAEDAWEPLRLDLGDPQVDEAIDGIEGAIEAIRADNGFASAHPEVRDAIVSEATEAIKSIKAGTATRGQVWRSLVGAGRWVAEKFGGSAIGAVGSELVKWALRLLGVPL